MASFASNSPLHTSSPSGVPALHARPLTGEAYVVITANLVLVKWANVSIDAKMITALLDRLTRHCHTVETGNDSYRFRHSSRKAKTKIRAREQAWVQKAKEDAEPATETFG